MSKLILSRADIERAVKQYYLDYEPELYSKYDFENTDMWFNDQPFGYSSLAQVIPEKEQE